MECIRGKQTYTVDTAALAAKAGRYRSVVLDLGTGDGYFVRYLAQTQPQQLVIGIDACREALRDTSRKAPSNALFVIANALSLPTSLNGLAASVTINFPWGSLLRGLVHGDPTLLSGLSAVTQPMASLEICLNAGALIELGCGLEDGTALVSRALAGAGLVISGMQSLDGSELRVWPSTWAKRLAFGRDPRAILIRAVHPATQRPHTSSLP